jgi:hypothetical protein
MMTGKHSAVLEEQLFHYDKDSLHEETLWPINPLDRISISRCQIMADSSGSTDKAYMLFRDIERQDHVSIALCHDLQTKQWEFKDLTDFSVGLWEPSYDTELWKRSNVLHVYVQNVDQGDGDRNDMAVTPTDIAILEWTPQ